MKKVEFYYDSADGITTIHGVNYIPEKTPKAILQIAHGMVEYIDRYDLFGQYLAENGILVTGNDHLGHGKSVISKEKYGYFAKEDGNRTVLQDMYRLTQLTQKEYPDIPYFLLGHSMGSFYVRQYLCEFGEKLDGAIIMGTGNQPYALVKAGILITGILARWKGWEYRSKFVVNMAFSGYNRPFQPVRTSKDWLTRDEKVVDAYLADECCSFLFTLNAYYNMFLGISRLHKKHLLNHMPKALPVLFMAGKMDPVGNFGKGVVNVAKSFQKLGMEDVSLKLYPEDRHEILNELDRETVYQDIYQWIVKKMLQK